MRCICAIIGLKLLNEVVLPESGPWSVLAHQTVTALRALPPDGLILMGDNNDNAASEFRNIDLLDDPNVFYTFHFYKPLLFTHQKAPWGQAAVEYDRELVYLGFFPTPVLKSSSDDRILSGIVSSHSHAESAICQISIFTTKIIYFPLLLLNASHIIPWSVDVQNRLNPRNGLCLNAILDRAFDRGLMTINTAFRSKFPRLSKILFQTQQFKNYCFAMMICLSDCPHALGQVLSF